MVTQPKVKIMITDFVSWSFNSFDSNLIDSVFTFFSFARCYSWSHGFESEVSRSSDRRGPGVHVANQLRDREAVHPASQ